MHLANYLQVVLAAANQPLGVSRARNDRPRPEGRWPPALRSCPSRSHPEKTEARRNFQLRVGNAADIADPHSVQGHIAPAPVEPWMRTIREAGGGGQAAAPAFCRPFRSRSRRCHVELPDLRPDPSHGVGPYARMAASTPGSQRTPIAVTLASRGPPGSRIRFHVEHHPVILRLITPLGRHSGVMGDAANTPVHPLLRAGGATPRTRRCARPTQRVAIRRDSEPHRHHDVAGVPCPGAWIRQLLLASDRPISTGRSRARPRHPIDSSR